MLLVLHHKYDPIDAFSIIAYNLAPYVLPVYGDKDGNFDSDFE